MHSDIQDVCLGQRFAGPMGDPLPMGGGNPTLHVVHLKCYKYQCRGRKQVSRIGADNTDTISLAY